MCPACLTTLALIPVGAGSVGGAAAVIVQMFRGKHSANDPVKQKPADAQAWTFARGQALLIAETANLLMLRPPKNEGEASWFARAMDLRSAAAQLGQIVAKRDYEASRQGLVNVSNQCNRCHQSFRVKVQITAFEENPGP